MRTLDDLLAEGVRGPAGAGPLRPQRAAGRTAGSPTTAGSGRRVPTIAAARRTPARGWSSCAHLGRPEGRAGPEVLAARRSAERLGELLGARGRLRRGHRRRRRAKAAVEGLADGDVVLLENVRFDAGGDQQGRRRARRVRRPAGRARRRVRRTTASARCTASTPASTTSPPRLPHAAGDLLLQRARRAARLPHGGDADRPYVVVLGGSKVSDKLGVIDDLLAEGRPAAGRRRHVLHLPQGPGPRGRRLAAGGRPGRHLPAAAGGGTATGSCCRSTSSSPPSSAGRRDPAWSPPTRSRPTGMGLDIGPSTVDVFGGAVAGAGTVFWNGPMGVFEVAPFAAAPGASPRRSRPAAGSPWSAAATRPPRCASSGSTRSAFDHISTGGGASLEYLEGKHPAGRWPCWRTDVAAEPTGRRPLIAGNWKMNLNHLEAIALVQKIAFSLTEPELEAVEVVVLPPFTVDPQRADAGRRRQAAARLRRPGPVPARVRGVHRRRRRADAGQARLLVRGGRALRAPAVPRRGRRRGRRAKVKAAVRERADPDPLRRRAAEHVRDAGGHVAHCCDQLDARPGRAAGRAGAGGS